MRNGTKEGFVETTTTLADTTAIGSAAPQDPLARERARLAYAIHDGLTQVVTASVLELEWLARRAQVEPTDATEILETAADHLREALDEVRAVLAGLSPEHPDAADRLDDLVRDVLARWQLPAHWSIEGDLHAVPGPVLDAASSVIRESVANAAKHSTSREVTVRVHVSRLGIDVRVEDHGRGFRPEESRAEPGHLGLEMMHRRVAELNGTLDIQSSPGKGTRVVARLPVTEQGEGQ